MAAPSSAAGSQPTAESLAARRDDISDQLAIQQAILASLMDQSTPPASEAAIAAAKSQISNLQKELSDIHSRQEKGSPTKTHSFTMHCPDLSGASTPSTLSTASNSGGSSSAHHSLPTRKRSFGTHTGAAHQTPSYNKHIKTSPSHTEFNSPLTEFDVDDNESFIDLTGNDNEYTVDQQKLQWERINQNKKLTDLDAELARRLQDRDLSPSPVSVPSSSGSTAFDRILGRASRPLQTNLTDDPFHSQGHGHGQDGASAAHKTIPENLPRPKELPNAYRLGSNAMPCTFEDSEDSDDSVIMVSSIPVKKGGPQMPIPTQSSNHPQLPGAPAGYGQSSNLQFIPGIPASELARRAAVQRQQSSSNPLSPAMSVTNRRASLTSLQLPGPVLGSQSAEGQSASEPLGSIIERTSMYNYDNLTDGYGNPLNYRLRNYYADLVEDPRKTEAELKDLLSTIRPDMDIPEEEREGTPDAMKYALYPHQQLALQWMKDKEKNSNQGGILADDMGLGKTISTIALMVMQPSPDNIKTNLIVGPVALIKQWESEIKKKLKVEHSLSVFLLHGMNRKTTYDDLRRYDVILTTYGTIASEYKRLDRWKIEHHGSDPGESPELARSCPLLHPKSRFYRVILDEAQCIKNHNTQSAKGAHHITAKYRWCLTGTPMMNGVHELFSLIHFLKIRPYNNQREFNKEFACLTPKKSARATVTNSERKAALQKLQAVLKAIMLRRMKNSQIDGKPILTLPPKTEETVHVVFSSDEQKFYTDLESESQVQFSKYLRAGTVGKNYSNVLVLLLRLRQACCHPHLNLDFEYAESANVDLTVDQVALARSLAPAVIARLKAIEAFECPICFDAVANPSIVIPCGHDTCPECLSRLTDNSIESGIQAGQEGGAAKCPQCRGPLLPEKIINYTVFTEVHMREATVDSGLRGSPDAATIATELKANDESETESEDESGSDSDDEDVDKQGNLRDFIVPDDEVTDDHSADEKKPKKKKKSKGKSKGKGKEKAVTVQPHELKTLRIEARKNKESYRKYMRYLRDNWEPSAKVSKCVEILSRIQKTDEKTIVFSQWTGLLDLLEIQMKYELGLKYCRYDGSMSSNHRSDATRAFMDNNRVKVMLVSLKAGNAGLNLTAASQIIILDPFWNPYIEMQAVDRAHRIGQQRPVKVHRVLVAGTVEDRIIELQEKKRSLVEAALDEGESKNLGRLSVRELCYLFKVNQ